MDLGEMVQIVQALHMAHQVKDHNQASPAHHNQASQDHHNRVFPAHLNHHNNMGLHRIMVLVEIVQAHNSAVQTKAEQVQAIFLHHRAISAHNSNKGADLKRHHRNMDHQLRAANQDSDRIMEIVATQVITGHLEAMDIPEVAAVAAMVIPEVAAAAAAMATQAVAAAAAAMDIQAVAAAAVAMDIQEAVTVFLEAIVSQVVIVFQAVMDHHRVTATHQEDPAVSLGYANLKKIHIVNIRML